MPAPLSHDLRQRIIASKLRGDTESKIAEEKGVSQSTVTKLWSLYKATGSYAPRLNPRGRKPALSLQELDWLRGCISHQPDITLEELKDRFCLSVSISALSRIVRFKLGFHYKKNATPCRTTRRRCQNQAPGMERGATENAR